MHGMEHTGTETPSVFQRSRGVCFDLSKVIFISAGPKIFLHRGTLDVTQWNSMDSSEVLQEYLEQCDRSQQVSEIGVIGDAHTLQIRRLVPCGDMKLTSADSDFLSID